MKISVSIAAALLVMSNVAVAGPFGIDFGEPLSRLTILSKIATLHYQVRAPEPNPEFDLYTVIATQSTGVCKITAIGQTYQDDAYGTGTKEAFERIRTALIQKYGPSIDYDFIKTDALWEQPREWVMSIKQNERVKVSLWRKDPNSVGIILQVKALSRSDSYITLSYESPVFEKCVEQIRAIENGSL